MAFTFHTLKGKSNSWSDSSICHVAQSIFPGKHLSILYSHQPFVLWAGETILELSFFEAYKWLFIGVDLHQAAAISGELWKSSVFESPVQLLQPAWMRQFWTTNTVTVPHVVFRISFVSASPRVRVIRPSDSSQPWRALTCSMDAGWLTYWNIPISNIKREPHPWWKSTQGIPAVMVSQMNILPYREDATVNMHLPHRVRYFHILCLTRIQNAGSEASPTRSANCTPQERKLIL